ncbi:MAG TPA: 3'(2'),5'-bisphosphate nucleotidase CysQ [Xanthobacteraceae bacterium]|nr:3'(2'),5'-bisphosphate nucleotidase CysQ [Xanthobacteraceae bacterium]
MTAEARLLDELTFVASRAAAAILALPAAALARRNKPDGSPVTAADEASEAVIQAALRELLPGIPVISEETGGAVTALLGSRFVLVDPLDGTREFLAGRDEFTVNIAIVENGTPRLGVIAAPARGVVWRGIVGSGAERLVLAPGEPARAARERRPIRSRPRPAAGVVAVTSRSHFDAATQAWLRRLNPVQQIRCGSSLKFALIAEGIADVYPRLSPVSEWDIAAGHAVLLAAGGAVRTPAGAPLSYGRSDLRIPAFVASGDPDQQYLF